MACNRRYELNPSASFESQLAGNSALVFVVKNRFDLAGQAVSIPKGASLLFEEGGYIDNGRLVGNKSSIKGVCNSFFGRNLTLGGSWKTKSFYVDWWDCYADGENDDYLPLHNMSLSVSAVGGGKVIFPEKAEYLVGISFCDNHPGSDKRDYVLDFSACEVDIDMNGATLYVAPNGYPRYTIVMFRKNSSFSLRNGHLVGDRLNHDYSASYYPDSHEFCFGVDVSGSRGTIRGMQIEQFPGDGARVFNDYDWQRKLTISEASATIVSCEIHHNRRQGISVADCKEVTIKDCFIHDIGDSDGLTGTSPKAAIDLEFESGPGVAGSIVVSNCRMKDCDGGGVVTGSRNMRWDKIAVFDCTMDNALPNFINQGNGKYDIHDLTITGRNKDAHRTVFNLPSEFYNIKVQVSQYLNLERESFVRNCKFISEGDSFYIAIPEGVVFDDCTFDGLIGEPECSYIPGITNYGGFDLYNGGKTSPYARFHNCELKNCGFFLNGKCSEDDRDFVQVYFDGTMLSDVFFNDINTQCLHFKDCVIRNVNSRYQVVKRVIMEDCDFEDLRGERTSGFNSADLELSHTKTNLIKYCNNGVKSGIKAERSDITLRVSGQVEDVNIELKSCTIRTNIPTSIIQEKRTSVLEIK